jgi:C1A family cysteine protease
VFLGCFGTVRDQHNRGTCVAHAVCAVLECLYAQSNGDSIDFSEQFAYWDAKQHDGHPNDDGTFIEVSLPQTQHDGVCEEAVWPYNPNPIPGNEAQGPPPAGAQTAAQAHLSSNVTQLDARNPRDIRNAIDAKHPVAISVPVYQNWFNNPAVNLYGTIPMPLPTSVLKGGHALCVAGYGFSSDFTGGGYFILRNSWGPQWAALSSFQPGYGAIPFDYVANYAWEAFTADGVS